VKPKGRIAWLITWEGPESEHNGRCRIVTILRPQLGQDRVAALLPVLYSSEYHHTLDEKLGYISAKGRDPFFKQTYRDINPEFIYGCFPKNYLRARQVKNLRCNETRNNCFEHTLSWTELPKFIPNPKYGETGPPMELMHDDLKQVCGEVDRSYTYSIRPAIEEEKARKEKSDRSE
jgi:hypothetical protein